MDAFAGHLVANLASAGIYPGTMASAGIDPRRLLIDMWKWVSSGEAGKAEALLADVIKFCTPASAVPAADAQNPGPPAPASAAPPAAASAAPTAAPVPELTAPPAASAAPAATPASAAHAVPELVAPAASSAPAATTAPASAAHAVPEVVAPASAVPAPAVPTAGAALETVPVTPPPSMLASPRAGLPAMPTEPIAAAASAVHHDACHIDAPSCKAVMKGARKWLALAKRPAASAATAATDSQPGARMLLTDLRTAFMNAMLNAPSPEAIEPVSEFFKHVNPDAHLAPTNSQMAWAIEQAGVQLEKAEIEAMAADICSTWRGCRRGMQRHHECDKIVGRMWPGRCVQDVALAIDDKAKYEEFMDTLVFVHNEFSILASAMATDPAEPERLMKRPAASAAPASPGSEENDFEGESAPPPNKKTRPQKLRLRPRKLRLRRLRPRRLQLRRLRQCARRLRPRSSPGTALGQIC